jgi:hypothetical protein
MKARLLVLLTTLALFAAIAEPVWASWPDGH